VLLLILISGIGACNSNGSSASIHSVTLSRSISDEQQAVDSTTEFRTTDSIIHCVVELGDAPKGVAVRATWVAVSVDGVEGNNAFSSTVVETDGESNLMDFALHTSSLRPGRYRADVYLNPEEGAEPDRSIAFTLNGPRIVDVFISTDPNSIEMEPVVPPAAKMILCRVALAEPAPNTTVYSSWVAEDVHGGDIAPDTEFQRVPYTLKEDEAEITFSFVPTEPLPPGTYRVDLYIGNATSPFGSIRFDVSPDA
jgi:hypothetical protein